MTSDEELDDLIGGSAPTPAVTRVARRRFRARPEEIVTAPETLDLSDLPDATLSMRQAAIRAASSGKAFIDSGVLKRPVSSNLLAQVFDIDPATVKKRLIHCPPLGIGPGNKLVYDFKEACAFLIPPQMDIEDYLNSMDPNTLPNHINKAFWEAKRIRLAYMLAAGEAWNSEDVLSVFGDVFMTLKNVTQLWIETLRDGAGLSDDQYVRMQQMVDALLNDIHEKLIDIPNKRETRSLAAEETAT